jgi:hypothetical protein
MHPRSIAGALVFGLTLAATPLLAQSSDRYSTYDRSEYDRPEPHRDPAGYATPPGRRVVIERVAPRVVTVEWMAGRMGSREVWVGRGYRPVTLWVVDGRYYDRYDPYWERGVRRPDIRQIVVYERDGRYWRDYDGDGDHDRRDEWLAQHDRWHYDHAYDRDFDRKHREWHRRHQRDNRDWDWDGDRD